MTARGQGIRRGLTRTAIVDAALRLIKQKGVAALSMRAVATELDVEAMSLYNHVRNKEDLLDALIEHVDQLATAEVEGLDWRGQLVTMAIGYRQVMHDNPEVLKLHATRPTVGPSWATLVEFTLSAFASAGLSAKASAHAYRIFWAYVSGYVIREVRQFTAPELAGQLSQLSADSFPLTRELANLLQPNDDSEFRAGLELILDALVPG